MNHRRTVLTSDLEVQGKSLLVFPVQIYSTYNKTEDANASRKSIQVQG